MSAPTAFVDLLTATLGSRLNTHNSFLPTRFVWSRGLALLCDHNGGLEFVRRQRGGCAAMRFDARAYANICDGDLVWVRSIALPQFVSEVLPHTAARFALLSGDEDTAVPSGVAAANSILAHENVICWFAQNFDGTDRSGKLHPLPIGLDFHTISNGAQWGHWRATPAQQQASLDALRATMPANERRIPRVQADFHLTKHPKQALGDSRETVHAILARNPNVDFLGRRIRRMDLWRERTRYAFVVSPHGNGLDCHRTWESLALSNIVIVKSSSLDPLYEGLPVVIINDWTDISADNLRRWHAQHSGAFAEPEVQERLTNNYWISKVRRTVTQQD